MEPKISIIVPVYNVEKYLERCVESILKQTMTNFELILIDDGSSDTVDKYVMSYHVKMLVFECFISQMEESLMQEI